MKWLVFRDDVKKTPAIARTAELMDEFFEEEPTLITSGLRTVIDQFQLIREKAKKHDFLNEFPEMVNCEGCGIEYKVNVPDLKRELYYWQRTWSKLLNIGEIINPPIVAECLFDYHSDGRNKKGEIIQLSNHQRGLALDIGGGDDVKAKAERVLRASKSGQCFIKGLRIEDVNNCVHVDLERV